MGQATPRASIILPAYLSAATIHDSLHSLDLQTFRDFEVIVVDSSPDDETGRIVRDRFPDVRYVHCRERLLPHQARNRGVEHACGTILVFTDPDCVADPDWLARLAAHHRNGLDVVGGAIRSRPGWWNHAVQASKYPWWLPESKAGFRTEIPSGNCSLSRDVWKAVGGFQGRYFAGDSEFCWRIRAAGYRIWFDPDAVVTHLEHPGAVPFTRERFLRGCDFGRMRVELEQWSRGRCLLHLLATPIVPGVMTWRSASYAVRGRGRLRWLTTLPVQVLANSLWSLGEASVHGKALWTR